MVLTRSTRAPLSSFRDRVPLQRTQSNNDMNPQVRVPSVALRTRRAAARFPESWLPLPDVALDPGDRLCLVGPNGCGKTSLIEVLSGLRPHRGEVEVLGVEPGRAMDVGILLDRPSLPMDLPLERSLARLAAIRDLPPGAVDEALVYWGLPAETRPGRSSMGERVRADLARALLHRPGLLLLDESVMHLDHDGWRLLETCLEGVTALLVAPREPAHGAWEVRPWE